jgi:hypothetical protein
MPNLTLAIPEDLFRKMKQFEEIKWSEVARTAISKYIHRLELLTKLEREEKLNYFDNVFKNSVLTEEDIEELDIKVKEGIDHKLRAKYK